MKTIKMKMMMKTMKMVKKKESTQMRMIRKLLKENHIA